MYLLLQAATRTHTTARISAIDCAAAVSLYLTALLCLSDDASRQADTWADRSTVSAVGPFFFTDAIPLCIASRDEYISLLPITDFPAWSTK